MSETPPLGCELDAAIDEQVFGMPVVWRDKPEGRAPFRNGRTGGVVYDWADVPAYSTCLLLTCDLLAHFRAHGWEWMAGSDRGRHYCRLLRGEWDVYAEAKSLAEAICRAALLTVEGEDQ